MFKPIVKVWIAAALCVSSLAFGQSTAPTESARQVPVTVVVEVVLAEGSTASEALAALNDMRAMMKIQPGYLSEEFLQNLNPDNSPRYVHVSRWAAINYWASTVTAPEFSKLRAHSDAHYTISASAFLPAQ
jgi:heme-degrading monooxygenase HmoA